MVSRFVFSLVLHRHSLSDFLPFLQSLAALAVSRPDYSLVLAVYDASPDDFSSPGIAEIAESVDGISLVYRKSKNIGFGSANNRNFELAKVSGDDVFVVANPDITFIAAELAPLLDWLRLNSDRVSCVAPLIVNASGDIQYSAKKNPTFLSLLLGRFAQLKSVGILADYDAWHKSLGIDYRASCIESPYLSGCFLVIPCCYYSKIGGFCERFFLHLEDADLVRRLSMLGISLHNPIGKVTHLWARGSHRSLTQMLSLVRSWIIYSCIWGFSIA
jgi:GT2 family glycosyltransferase